MHVTDMASSEKPYYHSERMLVYNHLSSCFDIGFYPRSGGKKVYVYRGNDAPDEEGFLQRHNGANVFIRHSEHRN